MPTPTPTDAVFRSGFVTLNRPYSAPDAPAAVDGPRSAAVGQVERCSISGAHAYAVLVRDGTRAAVSHSQLTCTKVGEMATAVPQQSVSEQQPMHGTAVTTGMRTRVHLSHSYVEVGPPVKRSANTTWCCNADASTCSMRVVGCELRSPHAACMVLRGYLELVNTRLHGLPLPQHLAPVENPSKTWVELVSPGRRGHLVMLRCVLESESLAVLVHDATARVTNTRVACMLNRNFAMYTMTVYTRVRG